MSRIQELIDSNSWGEAERACLDVLDKSPGDPTALYLLGILAAKQGAHASALAHFDAVVKADPRSAAAQYNRGAALAALGRREAAVEAFGRVVALDPECYAAHRALGFLYLGLHHRGRALDHFSWTYELRRGENRIGIAERSLRTANRTKLDHDAAQLRHLGEQAGGSNHFTLLARTYAAIGADLGETVTALSEDQLADLGRDYNLPFHVVDAPEMSEGALATRPDRDREVGAFTRAGAVQLDDLLSPRAFAALRRYLLESTVWHDFGHIPGHVASFLEDGLASPLLLQIADELRELLPEVLAEHPLSQAWAFRGVRPTALVDAHADDAAISVNFWLTPTTANRDPDRGGMEVCLVPPPVEWAVDGYADGVARATAFIDRHGDRALAVPYAENRAVLFRSRLLHRSDRPSFDQTYEGGRLNVTMLFGAVRAP